MRLNLNLFRMMIMMIGVIIVVAGVRADVIGFNTLTTADPMQIIAVFVALMGLVAMSLLFVIARALTEQTRMLREAEQRELARTIERVRTDEQPRNEEVRR